MQLYGGRSPNKTKAEMIFCFWVAKKMWISIFHKRTQSNIITWNSQVGPQCSILTWVSGYIAKIGLGVVPMKSSQRVQVNQVSKSVLCGLMWHVHLSQNNNKKLYFIIIKYVGLNTPIYFEVINIVLLGRVSIFCILIWLFPWNMKMVCGKANKVYLLFYLFQWRCY